MYFWGELIIHHKEGTRKVYDYAEVDGNTENRSYRNALGLWDRKLIKELFDFDYTWEVYTPIQKRKYGYYVLRN